MKLIYIILLILLTGCTSQKENIDGKTNSDINVSVAPKIIFLNCLVSKNLDETIKVKLVNKIITEGNLKRHNQNTAPYVEGDYKCIQLDMNSLPIDSLYISNPLITNIEYAGASGILNKKRIELDSADFSIRMQLDLQTKFIILKSTNNPNTILLELVL